MTNPIKRFFQILKSIVLFPISFIKMKRTYQNIERLGRLPKDPEEIRRVFAELGIKDEILPSLIPGMPQEFINKQMNAVDLSYLEEEGEEDDDESLDD